jgi:hypothetical protein
MKKKQKNESVLSKRGWLFLAKFTAWVFLALWSCSAFFEHLDQLKASTSAYWGAFGTEAIMLILIVFSTFYPKLRTRKEALILNVAVGILVLVHAGGLRTLLAAHTEQTAAESRLAENLKGLGDAQALAAQKAARIEGARIGRVDASKNAQATIRDANKAAINSLSEFTKGTNERVISSSFFPRWYVVGGMFSFMFICGFVALSRVLFLAINDTDYDRDYNGVADAEEEEITQTEIAIPKD